MWSFIDAATTTVSAGINSILSPWNSDDEKSVTPVAKRGANSSNNSSNSSSASISRRSSIEGTSPPKQLIKQSSHYHKHYIKLPIYAEIGPQCETYLKSMLDIQPGLIPPPIDPLPLEECSASCALDFNSIIIVLNYVPLETLIPLETCKYDYFVTLVNHVIYDRAYLRCCAKRGFTDRSLVWPWLVAYSIEGYRDLYVKKLIQWRQVESGDIDAPEFVITFRGLTKDIHRTFSNNRIMNLTSDQQKQLQTLLGIYSLLDPEVGYVQGMNFIAGLIILAIDSELDAFGIFCQIMKRNKSPPHNPLLHNVPPILQFKRKHINHAQYNSVEWIHKHNCAQFDVNSVNKNESNNDSNNGNEKATTTTMISSQVITRSVTFDENDDNSNNNNNNSSSINNNNSNERKHKRKRTNNLTWYMEKQLPNGEPTLSFSYDNEDDDNDNDMTTKENTLLNSNSNDNDNHKSNKNIENSKNNKNNLNEKKKNNNNNNNNNNKNMYIESGNYDKIEKHRISQGRYKIYNVNTMNNNNKNDEFKTNDVLEDLEMLRRKKKYDYAYCGGGRVSKTGQYGYGVRDMFTECLPGCVVCLLEFEQLLQKYLPMLYQHMKSEGLHVQSFASEWFMTLFSYVLPLSLSFRILDLFMVDGHKILHRVGLCILTRAEKELLSLSLDAMLMYLKAFPDSGLFVSLNDESEGDSFLQQALSFKVTNSALHQCAADLLAKTMVHVRMDQITS